MVSSPTFIVVLEFTYTLSFEYKINKQELIKKPNKPQGH